MKINDVDINGWQQLVDKFRKTHAVKPDGAPLAMRIENTQLTIARRFGGIVYNGLHYTYQEPRITGHEPNPDGTPYVAWLIVRDDFLKWAKKEVRTW